MMITDPVFSHGRPEYDPELIEHLTLESPGIAEYLGEMALIGLEEVASDLVASKFCKRWCVEIQDWVEAGRQRDIEKEILDGMDVNGIDHAHIDTASRLVEELNWA